MYYRAQGAGHRAQGTGHRAQGKEEGLMTGIESEFENRIKEFFKVLEKILPAIS